MKKTIVAITFLGLLALATPHPAAARVSVFFGLPGFGLFAGPPVLVAPPPAVVGPSWHGDRHHEGDWDDD